MSSLLITHYSSLDDDSRNYPPERGEIERLAQNSRDRFRIDELQRFVVGRGHDHRAPQQLGLTHDHMTQHVESREMREREVEQDAVERLVDQSMDRRFAVADDRRGVGTAEGQLDS